MTPGHTQSLCGKYLASRLGRSPIWSPSWVPVGLGRKYLQGLKELCVLDPEGHVLLLAPGWLPGRVPRDVRQTRGPPSPLPPPNSSHTALWERKAGWGQGVGGSFDRLALNSCWCCAPFVKH